MRRRLLVLIATAVFAVGCSSSGDDDRESTPVDAAADLCSALSIDELTEGGFLETDEPLAVTKRLDGSLALQDVYDVCEYGTYDQAGVTLQFNFGRPDLTLNQLIGVKEGEGQTLTLANGDTAFFADTSAKTAIAVSHDDLQFTLIWQQPALTDPKSTSPDKLRRLAETVADRLPPGLSAPERDIPDECKGLEAAAVMVVGEFGGARGSVNGDNLICDFVGSDGLLRAKATMETSGYLEMRAETLVESGPTKKTALADDATTTVTMHGGMRVDGVLDNCCTLRIQSTFGTTPEGLEKGTAGSLDTPERDFITAFLAAAREWNR